MSIIIFMLFVGYASVRAGFWVRGRVALVRRESSLPTPEPVRATPAHGGPEAVALFRRSNESRRVMTAHHRVIARALIADPDAPLGVIRSSAYRRAVRRGSEDLRGYLVDFERTTAGVRGGLERSGVDPDQLRRLAARIDAAATQIGRCRDFEPFPVPQVTAVGHCFGLVTAELEAIENAIAAPGGHPYRAGSHERHPSSHAQ